MISESYMSSSTTPSKTFGQDPGSGATVTRSDRSERVVASPAPPQLTARACTTSQPPTVTDQTSPSRSATEVDEVVVCLDELSDEGVLRPLVETLGVESCGITSSLKTAIRFDIVSASLWSWVT